MCTVSATCNILSLHLFKFRLSNKWNNSLCSSGPGGSQAICPGWSDVWWMPGCPLWRKVCSFLLCQCYLFAVLLWILLGKHTFTCWQGISQASCEGGRRSPTSRPIPLELKRLKVYEHVQERRALPQGWEASGNWCILPRIKNVCFLFYFEVTLLNLSKIVWYIKKFRVSVLNLHFGSQTFAWYLFCFVLNFALWFRSCSWYDISHCQVGAHITVSHDRSMHLFSET